jgi:transmembrane sensor
LAIAACAAGIAVIAVLVSSAPDPYRTGVGEQRTVSLPDGSEVVLDTDTSLKLSFTNDTRRVELAHGQALFHVAKDPTRPFTVVAGDGSVTALGTQFVVRREPAEMIVTLLEGSVEIVQQSRISAPATAPEAGSGLALPPVLHTAVQQIVLRPGQQVRSGAAGVSAPALPQLSEATAWKSGKLIFNDQPLGEAVDEVNRYARRKLRLGDPSLRAIRVSGVFDAGRTESFADALAGSMGLRAVSGEDGETVLLPRQK